jgi:hypothetical protein
MKKKLYSDDRFYRQTSFAWLGENDAKKLFFYGVCIEVGKAGIEIPDDSDDSDIGRLVHNSVLDRENALIRKLTELLTLIIGFKNSINDLDYRIFHSAQNLDRFLTQQLVFKDLYGERSCNAQSSIDDYKQRIDADVAATGQHPWFIEQNKLARLKPSVLRGNMDIYTSALALAYDDEKVLLGMSHERYSRFSKNVHATVSSHEYDEEKWDLLVGNIRYISMILMHIMNRSYELLDLQDDGGIKKIMGDKFEKSEASRGLKELSKLFEIGDIVFVHTNDLAEILDISVGKFGYTAFKIRYLSRPPLPEYPEDWLSSRYLTRIFKENQIRTFFEKSIEKHAKLPEFVTDAIIQMLKEDDQTLVNLMKKTLIRLHEDGLLMKMLLASGYIKKND